MMTSAKNHISRRKFLGQASCAAVGATTVFSTLFNLKTLHATAAFNSSIGSLPGDYKALVCILNAGGLDSFNMLVPRSQTHYNQYNTTRSNMALELNTLRPINPIVSDG
ncbi:MAG: twin-arginine translocation signal domain-containing protein, partial [Saprospiraceae bacterium]